MADCNFAGQQEEQDLIQGAIQRCTYLALGRSLCFVKEGSIRHRRHDQPLKTQMSLRTKHNGKSDHAGTAGALQMSSL